MKRLFALLIIWALSLGFVNAQGLATNSVERLAVDCLTDFAVAPFGLPDEYSVVIREKCSSYFDGRDVDTIYLFCEDRRSGSSGRFSATGEIGRFVGANENQRRWVQYLKTPTHRARRQGGEAFGRYSGQLVEDLAMDPDDSQIPRYPIGHDFPFYRPIAPRVDRSTGKSHTISYGRSLLDDLDFMRATKLEDGTIQSEWARQLWRVQLLFDPRQGNCPTRIIHFGNLDIEDPGPIICVHLVNWEEWKVNSKRSVWIPTEYRFRHSTPEYGMDYEIEGHLKWLDTSDESVMPELTEGEEIDWREKIRQRFDEDWSQRFSDWQNRTGTRSLGSSDAESVNASAN
ncbi:hypothetical protein NHH03_08130 [Stieleria sp. TO1_6]|nr:hypothetical protein [Stieleria tagensis]